VVLGVAPLLIIGTIYTIYWYPANQMTYPYFLSIIWLVILAFLSLYVYRYTWYGLGERHPLVHLSFGALSLLIFFIVPLIFLNNINLMLLPFRWNTYTGFLQALLLPNVIQRYLHFGVAVCAIIGFFAAIYFWYRGRKSDDPFYYRAQRLGLKWALAATILQGAFGPINYFSLPVGAYSTSLLVLVLVGLGLSIVVCIALIGALLKTSGKAIAAAVVLVGILAVLMSFIRNTIRENLLRGPNIVAARSTELYQSAVSEFMKTYTPPAKEAETKAVSGPAAGKQLFEQYCSMCHAFDHIKVGPPEQYMIQKYTGKEQDMIHFVLNPTKVNPNLPAMPKPPVTEEQAEEIVKYILSQGAQGKASPQSGRSQ